MTPKDLFDDCLQRVRDLHGLHASISAATTTAIDLSDILRAEIVLVVSALDFYVHEKTRTAMVEVVEGRRAPTDAFLSFGVSAGAAMQAIAATSSSWFEAEVRNRHSHLSFQQPDKVADAFRLFSAVKLWDEVAVLTGKQAGALKTELKLLVQRRNQIAHEADIDPSYPGQRWPIRRADVERSTDFVTEIVTAFETVAP